MSSLLHCQKISKSYRSRPLFENLSLAIEEGERVGIVGPNGAGKSTFMKIICSQVMPDDGKLTMKKDLRISYLAQEDEFEELEVVDVLRNAVKELHLEEHEAENRVEKQLTQFAFTEAKQKVETLSGGWKKRLAIARELIKEPDLLLLDEPTNHLDLDGVIWLEKLLMQARFSVMLISHDRQFLENVATRIVEINPGYEEGCLSVKGSYSDFLIAREEYFVSQAHLEQALASKVRREIAWLQRGARARQTKSSARIKDAGELMENLAEIKTRNSQNTKIDIDFDATGRKTKELVLAKGISKSLGSRLLFKNLDLTLRPGTRIGLIGANGSGKTTLLKIISDQLKPDTGTIKRADALKIVWFDQNREQLDQSLTLWKSLCPEGDSVVYRDRSIHVSTWARRFQFKPDQLHLPISYLSGGEQARILIANLMKQAADLLILDEPTNNLDLPSLEVLEESLLEFPGAVILVTHDRFMIHEVPNLILALDGNGGCKYFADYSQWENSLQEEERAAREKGKGSSETQKSRRSGLSTSEKKELLEIADRIELAELELAGLERQMEDPSIGSNHDRLMEMQAKVDQARAGVEKLYRRWEDLELRQAAGAS
ncbi:MAG: ABC-F family ATP-binding cassette domain-containing protein [Candidatus Obscuribacterales bacterium]|nr:ABC-F family ATP-binding cassette domain-containing protein [Candidatus Obscuribacterales bacterium]